MSQESLSVIEEINKDLTKRKTEQRVLYFWAGIYILLAFVNLGFFLAAEQGSGSILNAGIGLLCLFWASSRFRTASDITDTINRIQVIMEPVEKVYKPELEEKIGRLLDQANRRVAHGLPFEESIERFSKEVAALGEEE